MTSNFFKLIKDPSHQNFNFTPLSFIILYKVRSFFKKKKCPLYGLAIAEKLYEMRSNSFKLMKGPSDENFNFTPLSFIILYKVRSFFKKKKCPLYGLAIF